MEVDERLSEIDEDNDKDNKKGDKLMRMTQQSNTKSIIQSKFSTFKDYLEDDTNL